MTDVHGCAASEINALDKEVKPCQGEQLPFRRPQATFIANRNYLSSTVAQYFVCNYHVSPVVGVSPCDKDRTFCDDSLSHDIPSPPYLRYSQ